MRELRDALKARLQEQGINIKESFSRFDTNGDGVFSHMEFEMIFTVLDIAFTKDELRKLIDLTDTNKDGKIDMNEFHNMLYSDDILRTQTQSQKSAASRLMNDDIEVLEEQSNESDDDDEENDEDAVMRREI